MGLVLGAKCGVQAMMSSTSGAVFTVGVRLLTNRANALAGHTVLASSRSMMSLTAGCAPAQ
jgi:hypothetical protein